ncbi:hypothetical protein phiAS5_ORF0250 [Aeromonas phage phiAS5]|uniref:Phage protein n=1 Tax=Aeromonas phage phiAS5 TaxID=879630 RepID=E1A204_9CAUD|nr:hypothetical protein phiAS5_ORF0250 [Aeromonas phage phiAS5]ADM80093.1 hypothetical protein phiAS5_ORF0250 [Aeromonas phage phiAS5]BES53143.1 hypothetical protein [Aeromonas phage phiWae14]
MININETIKTNDGMTIKLWDLRVERGDIVACMTPEGPSDDFECSIMLFSGFMADEFRLNHRFVGKIVHAEDDSYYMNAHSVATVFMEKILAKGEIDINHWTCVKR